jgi:heterotetrameric sarcosine oxidase gamma subunit
MSAATRPVRRSPLEGLAPLAGRDLTLTEIEPLDKTIARGIGSAEAEGRVAEAAPVATWHLSSDEAIVVAPPEAQADAGRVLAPARSLVDVSSGYAVLQVAGRRARALLAEACPVDLSEGAVPDRAIVQANVANVRVMLARMDRDGQTAFTLLVARDEARYLWDALSELGGLGSGGHS